MTRNRLANLAFVVPPGMPWDVVRERLVDSTLRYTDGNKTAAARLLNVDVKTLHRWLREDPPVERSANRERVPA